MAQHAVLPVDDVAAQHSSTDANTDVDTDSDADTDAERRRPRLPVGRGLAATVILVGVAVVSVLYLPAVVAGGVMIGVAVIFLARRIVFSWVGWLGILVAVVMLVPVRRYALPIPLPFQLEMYRLVLFIMIGAMAVSLLLGGRRWRPVGFAWPIGLFLVSIVMSIPLNGTELVENGLASLAVGGIINWVLLLSVFFLVRQIVSTEAIAMGLLTALVWLGTAVAALATVERVTRVNLFWRLEDFLPLILIAADDETYRSGGYRSFGSSQHPIALSVLFCILLPIIVYLARYGRWPRNPWTRRIVYGLAAFVVLCGVLSAVSRTAVIVIAAMVILCLVLRPWLGITLLALAIPAFAVGTAAVPKIFSTLVGSFFDIEGLIASQQTSPGFRGAGRLADLGPSLVEAAAHPFFGTGLGSRIVVGENQNAFILDNQVLGTLLETGAVGVLGLTILIVAPVVMLVRWAMTTAGDAPRYALLAFAIAASGVGFAAGLFFYDAFGFYQTLFVWFMLLAVGGWLLTASPPALAQRAARQQVDRSEVPA